MTLQDLKNNRERIIFKIKIQITLVTAANIKSVMNKMIAMLPQFEAEKSTKSNIDKLTMKATLSYLKFDHKFSAIQAQKVDENLEIKRNESRPSSLQY